MTDRDRLIKLLQEPPVDWEGNRSVGTIADHLLANGVIVPPCKVGDIVWCIVGDYTYYPFEVVGLKYGIVDYQTKKLGWYVIVIYDGEFLWGEEAFKTEEDAERALKEREKE